MAMNIPQLEELELPSLDEPDLPNSIHTTGSPDSGHNNKLVMGDEIARFPDTEDSVQSIISGGDDYSTIFDNTARKVVIFDMRGQINKSIKGKYSLIHASIDALKQRLASMKGVSVDQLRFLAIPGGAITHTAVLDNDFQNITIFLKFDSEAPLSYRCITIPNDSTVEFLSETLSLSQPCWPFWRGQRLQDTSSLCNQGVKCGDTIDLCKIKTEIVKCLYRAASRYEQLFTIECLSIDSICELKLKICDTIRKLNKTSSSVSESVLNSHIWLTFGKRIFKDNEYIGFLESDLDTSTDSSDSQMTTFYDYMLHFQPPYYIPILVSYREEDARSSTVETVLVPKQSSSIHLCETISCILHCLPTAVKLVINGRKLPLNDDLSTFSEFKRGCMVYASVKRAITVNVSMGDELFQFNVMKMDKIETLKCQLADKIKKLPRVLKLKSKGQELVDCYRIEQQDIKDNSTVHAEIIEDRIQLSIRKRSHPITHFLVENLDKTSIRDLKNYYRHAVRLSAKLDIDLYNLNGTCPNPGDLATLKSIGTRDKEIYLALEKPCDNGPFLKIYEARDNGDAHTEKFGIIQSGVICYCANAPDMLQGSQHEDHVYSLASTLCNIRLAQPFEIGDFEFSTSPEPLIHVQSPVLTNPIRRPSQEKTLSLSLVSLELYRQMSDIPMSVTNTVNRFTSGSNISQNHNIRDLPGVVSDKELQVLAKELPAHNWQFVLRDMNIPESVIFRHTQANSQNVAEAIYQCLKDWKQGEGKKATKKVIQEKLANQKLLALSESIFDYNTV